MNIVYIAISKVLLEVIVYIYFRNNEIKNVKTICNNIKYRMIVILMINIVDWSGETK